MDPTFEETLRRIQIVQHIADEAERVVLQLLNKRARVSAGELTEKQIVTMRMNIRRAVNVCYPESVIRSE